MSDPAKNASTKRSSLLFWRKEKLSDHGSDDEKRSPSPNDSDEAPVAVAISDNQQHAPAVSVLGLFRFVSPLYPSTP